MLFNFPNPAPLAVQISPIAPPMPKHIAESKNGGTGEEPMVNKAKTAHIRTAEKPMVVARLRVID